MKDTEKPIRILHITHEMAIGGTQQVINQLITNLDSQRFDCEIACIDSEVGELGEKLQNLGTKIVVFQRGSGFDFNLIRQLKALIKLEKYDVVHCHQYTPYVYGIFASLFSKSKVVFTEHGRFHPDGYSWKRRVVFTKTDRGHLQRPTAFL